MSPRGGRRWSRALACVLLALGAAGATAAPEPFVGAGPWMVRAWPFGPGASFRILGPRFDHFAVDRQTGAALVFAEDAADLAWLRAAGFHLELDTERTGWIHDGRRAAAAGAQGGGIPGFPCYRTVEETFASAQALVLAHPDLARWVDAGDSWLKTQNGSTGYDIGVLVLGRTDSLEERPKMFVSSAIHAREYTTAESSLRFAEQLLGAYGTDPDATWLLDEQEIHLVLHLNPDGRKRAEAGEFWRKNVDNLFCANTDSRGVDLNRNFSYAWGCCDGSSTEPCAETFRGLLAASEPETQAMQSYLRAELPDVRDGDHDVPAPDDAVGLYIDVHSFGEWVLTPWIFRDVGVGGPNTPQYMRLARRLAFLTGYYPEIGGPGYHADGTTADFGYGDLGVASISFELGTTFFQSCATFQSTVLPQALAMLEYSARVTRAPYLLSAGPEALDLQITPATVEAGVPVVVGARLDDGRYSTANGVEPVQTVAAAEAFVSLPPWHSDAEAVPLAASDGAFDESNELVSATVPTDGLAPGRHLIFVRGRDSAAAHGPVGAIFLDVLPASMPFLDGFETGDSSRWSMTSP